MLVHHRVVHVDGLDVFYREAGAADAPVILLLHGFPTSSHMFRNLIPLLADRFRLIAPDYPGFGYSSAPNPREFDYTFDRLAEVIARFVDRLGLEHYVLYQQDFGGPIGFRLAVKYPERVRAHIIQNANAYSEGITDDVRDFVLRSWSFRTPEVEAKLRQLFELPATKRQFLEGAHDPSLVSPDAWQHAQWGMDRPGNKEIQFALQVNYASNVQRYGEWQAYLRARQPPVLVVWGEHDFVFAREGAEAYRHDVPGAELHFFDAGHFALETRGEEIASHIRQFLEARP